MVPHDSLVWFAVSLVWTFRALAATAGAFVIFDWVAHARRPVEFPPYNRRANATAWALAGAGCILAWFSYVSFGLYLISPVHLLGPNLVLALTWGLLGAALVMRAAARAEQPRFIWLSAGLIAFGSFAVLALGGRPEL